MTRRNLFLITMLVMSIYATAIYVGYRLYITSPDPKTGVYTVYKDFIPMIIAIPAAYLGYAFQRRNSYLQSLRTYWANLIVAINSARMLSRQSEISQDSIDSVSLKLSIVIDEARGVFKNLPWSNGETGFYPFEPIKEIYYELCELKSHPNNQELKLQFQTNLELKWKAVRDELLKEFDRQIPTHHHTWYYSQTIY